MGTRFSLKSSESDLRTPRGEIPVGQTGRRPDIQGLRALSVLLVVAFHAGLPVSGGFVGVDVFFVISGFVITRMLANQRARNESVNLRDFYGKRFRRLAPALSLVVVVTLVVSVFVLAPNGAIQNAAKTGIGAIVMSANFVIDSTTGNYFDLPAAQNPLLNTWSLSVEEQFYLIFPILLLFVWKFSAIKWPVFLVLIVTVASLILAIAQWSVGFLPSFLTGFYSPFGRAWEFGAGALLALVPLSKLAIKHLLRTWVSTALALSGLALVLWSAMNLDEATLFPSLWTLFPVVGTVFIIAGGSLGGNLVSKCLSVKPGVWLGNTSYSWYLWHWPVIVLGGAVYGYEKRTLVLLALISFAPAYIAYKLVEQPIHVGKSVPKLRGSRLFSLVLVPPLVLAILILFAASNSFWSENVRKGELGWQESPSLIKGCLSTTPLFERDLDACTWGQEFTRPPIYLVGDSNAAHFDSAVISVGNELRRPVSVITYGSCPLSSAYMGKLRLEESESCFDFTQDFLRLMENSPPSTILVASSDAYWENDAIDVGATIENLTRIPSEKALILKQGLVTVIERLEDAGHEVMLVYPVPSYANRAPHWSRGECSVVRIIREGCVGSATTEEMYEAQKYARGTIASVVDEKNVALIDPSEVLCPLGRCFTELDDSPLYIDSFHINSDGSKLLAPLFLLELSGGLR